MDHGRGPLQRIAVAGVAVGFVACVVAGVLTAWAWPHVPARIPTHFGANGQPNQWGSKGTLWLPVGTAIFFWLFGLVPYLVWGRRRSSAAMNVSLGAAFAGGLAPLLAVVQWAYVQTALGLQHGLGAWVLGGTLGWPALLVVGLIAAQRAYGSQSPR